MVRRRVVVTGLGAVCPLGNTWTETWDSAKAGKSGIGRVTRFDAGTFASQIAGEVKGFDPSKYVEQKELKKLDLFSQYAIAAAHEAWTDAGLANDAARYYQPPRMGCLMGIGIGGILTLEKYHQAYLEGGVRKMSPFLIPAMVSNLGPGNLAMRYGLKGPNYTITSACTSSTHAIGEAYRMIYSGCQDFMLTGGSEAAVSPIGLGGFCAMKALSTRNDEPARASRPFDRDRDGFILSEGAAIMVLEALDHAKQRNAKIYCEVIGYGASCDAYHITAPSQDGEGAALCMRNALEDCEILPQDVSYINAHGTSTPANDGVETLAIKKVFGDWARSGLLVSSTKSMTGHLLGAAGAIEALFSVMALVDGVAPPTINLDNPDEGCDLDYVAHQARRAPLAISMSNSFGFGGTNASVVFRVFE